MFTTTQAKAKKAGQQWQQKTKSQTNATDESPSGQKWPQKTNLKRRRQNYASDESPYYEYFLYNSYKAAHPLVKDQHFNQVEDLYPFFRRYYPQAGGYYPQAGGYYGHHPQAGGYYPQIAGNNRRPPLAYHKSGVYDPSTDPKAREYLAKRLVNVGYEPQSILKEPEYVDYSDYVDEHPQPSRYRSGKPRKTIRFAEPEQKYSTQKALNANTNNNVLPAINNQQNTNNNVYPPINNQQNTSNSDNVYQDSAARGYAGEIEKFDTEKHLATDRTRGMPMSFADVVNRTHAGYDPNKYSRFATERWKAKALNKPKPQSEANSGVDGDSVAVAGDVEKTPIIREIEGSNNGGSRLSVKDDARSNADSRASREASVVVDAGGPNVNGRYSTYSQIEIYSLLDPEGTKMFGSKV